MVVRAWEGVSEEGDAACVFTSGYLMPRPSLVIVKPQPCSCRIGRPQQTRHRNPAFDSQPTSAPLHHNFDHRITHAYASSIMATEVEYMQPDEIAQTLKTAQLEHVYQRCLREAERICEDEKVRNLRVQVLLLEDENDELQEKIDNSNDEVEKLEESNDEMRTRLGDVEAELERLSNELKARLRDIDHYKAEIESHNAANSEASKTLSEKLALSRELATLKPELEHLKSTASTQQNLLAEKLALQRELSSAQVELDNEKRTVQRLQTQREASNHDDSALHSEIDDLKKELAKVQKEVQKTARENIKKQTEWESQKDSLESKLDAFRTKLRTTKEQLKEAQDELEKSQAAKMAQSAELTKARLAGQMAPPPPAAGPSVNPRKRNIARFDPDMTIGTPGHGGPAAKRQRTSVNIGDKSTFSMTPFLNRTTMSILPETPSEETASAPEPVHQEGSPDDEMRKQIDSIIEEAEAEAEKKQAAKAAKEKPKAAPKKTTTSSAKGTAAATKATQPLKESTKSKANKVVQKPSLDKVIEEDAAEEPAPAPVSPPKADKTSTSNKSDQENVDDEQPAKKKRAPKKRPNIFDDEDEAPAEKSKKVKTLKVLNKGGTAGGLGGLGNVKLLAGGGATKGKKTFAEFSPLKKDRRQTAKTAEV